MALKWTKTSGPDSCVMNPKPLSPLNHLTVPVVIWTFPPFLARFEPTWFARPGGLKPPRELPATVLRTHTLSYEASRPRPPEIMSPRRRGRSKPPSGVNLRLSLSDPTRAAGWKRGIDEPQGCGKDGCPHRLELPVDRGFTVRRRRMPR